MGNVIKPTTSHQLKGELNHDCYYYSYPHLDQRGH